MLGSRSDEEVDECGRVAEQCCVVALLDSALTQPVDPLPLRNYDVAVHGRDWQSSDVVEVVWLPLLLGLPKFG